jgi:hypothetical protein
MFQPPGRSSRTILVHYKSFAYQPESWAKPRRTVAKVEQYECELFPRAGFIVPNQGGGAVL